jgi:hypothetical protein
MMARLCMGATSLNVFSPWIKLFMVIKSGIRPLCEEVHILYLLKMTDSVSKLLASSRKNLSSAACLAVANRTTGALAIPSLRRVLVAPQD